jgi:hypothetical protein
MIVTIPSIVILGMVYDWVYQAGSVFFWDAMFFLTTALPGQWFALQADKCTSEKLDNIAAS